MAYQQVRTVLEHVERFHREAAKRYDGMANECCNDRVKMLLEYLVSHQRLIERTINQSRVDMPDRVLETWLTTTHETAVLTDSIAKIAVPTTVDDVIELAMKLEDQVISVYQEIVNRDAPDWVVEKFRNLLDMEKHQQMRMVTQAMRGADL